MMASTKVHRGLMVGLSLMPAHCAAFHQPHRPRIGLPLGRGRTAGTRIRSTASSADQSVFDLNTWEGRETMGQQLDDGATGVELWLDLRGTSLSPETALELWEMEEQHAQLGDTNAHLMSEAPFAKCLVDASTHQTIQKGESNIDVMLVSEEVDGFFTPLQSAKQSILLSLPMLDTTGIGRLVTLQTSATMPVLPDPLPLMEASSRGELIVLDTSGWEKIGEEKRMGMVLPLVELISSVGVGGVGLTCQTKNEVVKAAMFLRAMTNGGGGGSTRTLESGIVIPDDDATGNKANKSNTGTFAIVVPYDLALLRTAKLLLSEESGADG